MRVELRACPYSQPGGAGHTCSAKRYFLPPKSSLTASTPLLRAAHPFLVTFVSSLFAYTPFVLPRVSQSLLFCVPKGCVYSPCIFSLLFVEYSGKMTQEAEWSVSKSLWSWKFFHVIVDWSTTTHRLSTRSSIVSVSKSTGAWRAGRMIKGAA